MILPYEWPWLGWVFGCGLMIMMSHELKECSEVICSDRFGLGFLAIFFVNDPLLEVSVGMEEDGVASVLDMVLLAA
jgi:hypothetical protein